MGFVVAQAGNTLYKFDPTSGTATALTLPTGVTIDSTRRPKFAVLNQWVAVVNSPSKNLVIDPEGTVRVMVPTPPQSPPSTAAGSSTGLTGAYKVRVSFVVLGSDGSTYMESPLSPASISVTLANNDLALTRVPTSNDDITLRRLYRTAAGGTLYYFMGDVDGNTQTSFLTNLSDVNLALLPTAASTLTAPPGTLFGTRLKNIASWKGRLWAVADDPTLIDTVYYSEDNKVYAWPNSLIAHPTGQDKEGIVAFCPRRDQMGVLKRNGVWQITGSSNSNFAVMQIAVGKDPGNGRGGCIAADSVLLVNDTGYWLGKDGVYEWGAGGVVNISDADVLPWFTTGTYFNRDRFQYAFSKFNPITNCIEIHLAAAGSSVEDRWVSFNLSTRKWYGPHKTAAFTPTSAATTEDANGLPVVLVGASDDKVYVANQSTFHDGASSAIDFDVFGPFHYGNAPDIEHYFGELSMLTKIQSSGTLSITPYLGRLDASAGSTISHDMTLGRQRLERIGVGAAVRLRFQQATADVGCAILGYELPFHELGRR